MDASHPLINRAARWLGHLTFLYADIKMQQQHGAIEYVSSRTQPQAPPAEFHGRYTPETPVFQAKRGSLTYWLTERYCLYTATGHGTILRYEIHHPSWPLQEAKLQLFSNTGAAAQGITLPQQEPLLHFVAKQTVVLWPPYKVQ